MGSLIDDCNIIFLVRNLENVNLGIDGTICLGSLKNGYNMIWF